MHNDTSNVGSETAQSENSLVSEDLGHRSVMWWEIHIYIEGILEANIWTIILIRKKSLMGGYMLGVM